MSAESNSVGRRASERALGVMSQSDLIGVPWLMSGEKLQSRRTAVRALGAAVSCLVIPGRRAVWPCAARLPA